MITNHRTSKKAQRRFGNGGRVVALISAMAMTLLLLYGCGGGSSGVGTSSSTSPTAPTDNPPVAVISANPLTGTAPLKVNLDGSGSTDDNGITAYGWTFGDGDSASGASVTHTYQAAGSYEATLTVTDTAGQTGTATVTITVSAASASALTYPIVDTGQTTCYDSTTGDPQACTGTGYDADYQGNQPSYTLSSDGLIVTDNVTGLIWTAKVDINGDGVVDANDKLTQPEAAAYCSNLTYGGYAWRLPSIKELYSLIDFKGTDPSSYTGNDTSVLTPFIDDTYFQRAYGDTSAGERIIDGQFATSTFYVSPLGTINGAATMFGVNFADGRIKGYPYDFPANNPKTFYVRCVTGNTSYGVNDFVDNGDGTVSDLATGLMWQQNDYQSTNFEDAVSYCESATTGGYDDWRLPNAKELQSIVDYSRAPDYDDSPAIDPVFNATSFTNEAGQKDWGYYWSSTTHVSYPDNGTDAAYVAFGRALGYFNNAVVDVHGAGAQRSDGKMAITPQASTANVGYGTFYYFGPQGDIRRLDNYVRCVRDDSTSGSGTQGDGSEVEPTAGQTTGLFLKKTGSYNGYTLFAPMMSTTTYLIDNDGNIVHTWDSSYKPGLSVYLLENGDLLRTGNTNNTSFTAGGAGGIVQEFDANSNVIWSYTLSSSKACLHHDVAYLPDGDILMIAWEMRTKDEAVAAGRNPSLLSDGELWPDEVIEVDPSTNDIVWQWHVWDHLVQDYDSTKANYGVVSDHPELVDLNYTATPKGSADWTHINSVAYNSDRDQILLSVHNFSEVWVIDHSTTTAEAASHSGGKYGKGGDILYRWGNPAAYGMGTSADQKLYGQHDATWIPTGYPGAGDILLFNNGAGRPDGNYSSIEEFTPPVDGSGNYSYTAGSAYGPDSTLWTYTAPTPTDFYSSNISSAQRLPNGDTLICAGTTGTFFEVTPQDDTVWKYVNPVTDSGILGKTDTIPTNPQGGQTNIVFRAERYAPDYPGLSGIVQ